MKLRKYTIFMASMLAVAANAISCVSLDIPPLNVIDNDDIYNETGIKSFMSALYSRMPIEDFKSGMSGDDGYNSWDCTKMSDGNIGIYTNSQFNQFTDPARGYWNSGYEVIRAANDFIANLPGYSDRLGADKVTAWVAEARFVRAFTYFELAKRYGGVPLLDKVQTDMGNLKVPRNSEQETFDLILADLDYAIDNLPEKSENSGRVNRYAAAAMKSRVALYAGSIARYGTPYTAGGVMLCGIPSDLADNYFREAWEAAKSIEGIYSLYMAGWKEGDKEAQADNFANLFFDESSTETIFSKGYFYPNSVHSWDAIHSPIHISNQYGSRCSYTLDFVELFDGLPLDEQGHLKTVDDNGYYIVYDDIDGPFKDCEPRLRGTVLLPGMEWKGVSVDLRRGIIRGEWDPAEPIQKFIPEGGTGAYQDVEFFKENVVVSDVVMNQTPYEFNGMSMYPTGASGPLGRGTDASVTGFHGRKLLDPDLPVSETYLHRSTQQWIEIRYAEVLLNRAEAALELLASGAGIEGVDLQQDAFECINLIRRRAGADLLTSSAELSLDSALSSGKGSSIPAPNRGLQLLRIERRKELAMENKCWWDSVRWRTADQEVNSRSWRICNPFLFANGAEIENTYRYNGKYIFDCRYDEGNCRYTIPVKYYYQPIPEEQIKSNDLLLQNPLY